MGSSKDGKYGGKGQGASGCGCGGRGHAPGHECAGACGGGCRCKALGRIRELSRAGMTALEGGDHDGAEAMLRQALALGRDIGVGPVIAAKTRNSLGIVLHGAGRPVEALAQYHTALTLIEARVGADNRLYRVVAANSRKAVDAA